MSLSPILPETAMTARPATRPDRAGTLARSLARGCSALAVAALTAAASGAGAQSAFPRSSLQPSPYTTARPAGPPMAAAGPMAGAYGGAGDDRPVMGDRSGDRGGDRGGERVRVDMGGAQAPSRILALPRGKSAMIELPTDARDVIVSDPKTADVVLSTPRRIFVMGMGAGQTDATFYDLNGRVLMKLDIRVDQDVSGVGQTLARILPGTRIHADAVNNNIILSGEASGAGEVDKAMRIAASFVAKPEQVLNMMSVSASEQVMLKVKIVEVNRSVIKQLGFNTQAVINRLGSSQGAFAFTPTYGINGALLGGLTGGYGYTSANNQGQALLQAFERVGLVRTLAEPNLTAVSGESAKFLAGGEFPVPVAQDSQGRITVEFKPFGVGLGFTPVVLSNGRISLKLSTEVSEITNVNAFSTGTTGSGTTGGSNFNLVIPGLNVRRTETTVELPSGGAMMISGLLQSKLSQNLDSLPGLMQVPILGTLFRSRDFQNNETELVVIITPYLVGPVRPDQLQTPADGLQIADDVSTNLLGKLNKGLGRPAGAVAAGRTYQGPYGYVVE